MALGTFKDCADDVGASRASSQTCLPLRRAVPSRGAKQRHPSKFDGDGVGVTRNWTVSASMKSAW